MADLNSISLTGRLAFDTELKTSEKGTSYLSSKMAVGGYDKDTTHFIAIKAFGKTAEFIDKWFNKGDGLGITGELNIDQWEKEGVRHEKAVVVVRHAHFLPGRKGEGAPPGKQPASKKPDAPPVDDELPF